MSKPKHTPGPWKLDADLVISHNTRDMRARDGVAVARIQEPTNYLGQSKANAALIAAAPEMLRECKYALEFLNDWAKANQCAHDQGYQNFKFRLERAIAKAEGRDE